MQIREVAYLLCGVALLTGASACGSSSTVTTPGAPSAVRCAVTVSAATSTVPSTGGSGTITVSTARECTWSATSEVPWIALPEGREGQGDGTIPFTVTPNPHPTNRRGAVAVNGHRAELTQAAAPCRYDITPASAALGAGAGEIPVNVSTAAPCPWTTAASAGWISVSSGTGTGAGRVMVSVAPNTGPARSGTATIAGHTFAVSQEGLNTAPAPEPSPAPSPSCSITLLPASHTVGAAGGNGTVNVAAASGCGWTAVSNAAWLTIVAGNVGFGNGTIQFRAAANTGGARTGRIRVNDRDATVSQEAPAPPAPAPAPAPTPEPAPAPAPTPAPDVKVEGKLSSLAGTCPNVTFGVKGTKVITSGSTNFKGGGCHKLRNGEDVTVRGSRQADGSVKATEVDRDD